ncbi:FecR family protein [Cyclobacterium lianum]|uniref:FecR family protein n=1 Tax=Cyclobacterium lianum TaxID=388280 RepID=A0A1M7JSZ1_9BACT|nr:FecR domain-containing protein [Cyclobacterium lianum]SHM56108.1 FecR family protein [Cyclobacterium lianum]
MEDQLLIKYLLGEANHNETNLVESWIQAEEQNRRHFEQLRWVWDSSASLLDKNAVDEEEAWRQFKHRRDIKNSPVPRSDISPVWFRIAGVVLLLITVGWLWATFLASPAAAWYTEVPLETLDEAKTEVLPDGSVLTLNKNSQLTYSQKLLGDRRLVSMGVGEVFFEVVKNKNRPFVVVANEMTLTVLGTSFKVQQSAEMIEVIVESGEVKVAFRKSAVTLGKDEKVLIHTRNGKIERSRTSNKLFRYFVDGRFVADSVALPVLVEALSRAYETPIAIGSETARNMSITTTLEYGSLENNLELIRQTLGLRIIHQDDSIIIE